MSFFTLKKSERLKSKKAINFAFKKGTQSFKYPVKMIYVRDINGKTGPGMVSGKGLPKALFSVPKKHFKLAVDRNRMKRLMREAFRKKKHLLSGSSINAIVFVYLAKELQTQSFLDASIGNLLKKAAN